MSGGRCDVRRGPGYAVARATRHPRDMVAIETLYQQRLSVDVSTAVTLLAVVVISPRKHLAIVSDGQAVESTDRNMHDLLAS